MIDDLFGAPGSTFYAVAPRYWISGRAWRKLRGRGRPTRPAPPPPTAGRVLRLRLVSRAEGRQLWGRGFVRDRWTLRTPENASKKNFFGSCLNDHQETANFYGGK
ncbi:uncharacterized protein LOC144340815 isoform X2 [Macaca mulatta]